MHSVLLFFLENNNFYYFFLRTLNYVRKCCKFSRSHEDNAEKITLSDDDNDSIITAYPFQNTNSSDSPIRSALQSRESYRKKRVYDLIILYNFDKNLIVFLIVLTSKQISII